MMPDPNNFRGEIIPHLQYALSILVRAPAGGGRNAPVHVPKTVTLPLLPAPKSVDPTPDFSNPALTMDGVIATGYLEKLLQMSKANSNDKVHAANIPNMPISTDFVRSISETMTRGANANGNGIRQPSNKRLFPAKTKMGGSLPTTLKATASLPAKMKATASLPNMTSAAAGHAGRTMLATALDQPTATPVGVGATPASLTSTIPLQHRQKPTDGSGVSIDQFELLQVVGKGGFGKVFLVQKKKKPQEALQQAQQDDKREREVFAMKVLKKKDVLLKDQVENTRTEKRIMASASKGTAQHPYLVQLRYAFQTRQKLYLIMSYYPGGCLFVHLRRAKDQHFDPIRARFYAAEIMLGLRHLHTLDVLHRDIKMENVLVDAKGHVHLTDFGLSKEHGAHKGGSQTFCGTPEYVAPELLQRQKYGQAADWWSFGVMVYEMLAGFTPFADGNMRQIFRNIKSRPVMFPSPMDGFPTNAADLVRKLLTKNPEERMCVFGARALFGLPPPPRSSASDGSGICTTPEANKVELDIVPARFFSDLQSHPFFFGLDWELLSRKELSPPSNAVPDSTGATDTTFVEDTLEQADMRLTDSDDVEDSTGKVGSLTGVSRVFSSFYFDSDGEVDEVEQVSKWSARLGESGKTNSGRKISLNLPVDENKSGSSSRQAVEKKKKHSSRLASHNLAEFLDGEKNGRG